MLLQRLEALDRKVLWLATWMIHNANHIRPNDDGVKVGGHQASCASASTLLTALYARILQPEDRIAVKPHASPVMHAIHYLFGLQTRENLERFRGFGGAQSYPSRTKDACPVDFSTGSVGLGVGADPVRVDGSGLSAHAWTRGVESAGGTHDRPDGRCRAR